MQDTVRSGRRVIEFCYKAHIFHIAPKADQAYYRKRKWYIFLTTHSNQYCKESYRNAPTIATSPR